MDKIDMLKAEGNIVSSSINAIAFILYSQPQDVQVVTNDTGYKMFMITDNEANQRILSEYQDGNGEFCYVNLGKFNHIIKMLKNKTKYYVGDL